ncbi:hypothetical protein GCM10022260_23700 [Gaetbulibacter aestuarii]
MAWGQMKPENAVMFFGNFAKYKFELQKILTRKLANRKDIYNSISLLDLKNCKPAYFTKLIFYFTANNNSKGYIMDQWTAKSINLITGESLVKLDTSGYVTSSNNGDIYEKFCFIIDNLSKKNYSGRKYNGSEIELFLFDRGGKKNKIGDWRRYVKKKLLMALKK